MSSTALHEQIKADAASWKQLADPGREELESYPALKGLWFAIVQSIDAAIPISIDYEGKRYWTSVRMLSDISIRHSPDQVFPMASIAHRWLSSGFKPSFYQSADSQCSPIARRQNSVR